MRVCVRVSVNTNTASIRARVSWAGKPVFLPGTHTHTHTNAAPPHRAVSALRHQPWNPVYDAKIATATARDDWISDDDERRRVRITQAVLDITTELVE